MAEACSGGAAGQYGQRAGYAMGVFLAATALALAFLWLLPPERGGVENLDYVYDYEPVARNLLEGRGLTYPDGKFADRYPPGYPLILAALFKFSEVLALPPEPVLSWFHLIVFGLSAVVLWAIAGLLWTDKLALIPPLLFASYPFGLWLTKQPNSEIPFMLLYFGAAYLALKALLSQQPSVKYFLPGLLLGLAMLIRPISLGAGFFFSLVILGFHKQTRALEKWRALAVLHGGLAVAVLPWIGFVYQKTGQIILLSTNLLPSVLDGLTFAANPAETRRLSFNLSPELLAWMQEVYLHSQDIQSLPELAGFLLNRLAEQPAATLKMLGLKMLRAWYGTNTGRLETLIIPVQVGYLTLISWSCLASLRRSDFPPAATWMVILNLGYFWAVTVLVLSILRYMVPAIGLSFILAPMVFHRLLLSKGAQSPFRIAP